MLIHISLVLNSLNHLYEENENFDRMKTPFFHTKNRKLAEIGIFFKYNLGFYSIFTFLFLLYRIKNAKYVSKLNLFK